MTILQAMVLGMIQGLTEFLPVSSSGHLVLSQHLFGLSDVPIFFDVSLHMGTLMAILIVYFSEIRDMITAALRLPTAAGKKTAILEHPDLRLAAMILVGSIPTAIIGLGFHEVADQLKNPRLAGGMLLITALVLFFSRRFADVSPKETARRSLWQAVGVGVVQGLAVMPGISRSGTTIVAGLAFGLSRETAARFSFLLSLPAIVGAELLTLKDLMGSTGTVIDLPLIMGTATSFLVGWLALIFLLRLVKRGQLHLFAPYCLIVGLIAFFTA